MRDLVLEVAAPAKINLTLSVLGRRADGYHLLSSLTAFTRLHDLLRIAPSDGPSDGPDKLTLRGRYAGSLRETGNDNLIFQAAGLYREATGVDSRYDFVLVKRLPVAAGIGGGSADAAATLLGLDRLAGSNLGLDALSSLAERLGADVPACLRASALIMSGIGEQIEPIRGLPGAGLLLVNSGVSVSTPTVFRRLNIPHRDPPPSYSGSRETIWDWLRLAGHNDLTEPACEIAPEIQTVLSALRAQNKARYVAMSGSGATCFAMFDRQAEARRAAAKVNSQHPTWWVQSTALQDWDERTRFRIQS